MLDATFVMRFEDLKLVNDEMRYGHSGEMIEL